MKKKNLFMFALASFMFAACSENLPDGGDDGGGIINTDGEAWVSLNIKAGTTTKALHNPDEENGTTNESKVDKIMVVFFDNHLSASANPGVVDTKEWGSGDPEISTPGQPNGTATKAFKVKKTAKAFLVVLNPSPDFETIAGTATDFATINKAIIDTDVTSVIGAGKDYFMMTNAKGQLEPTTVVNSGSVTVTDLDLVTYPTSGEAELNPQKVTVDRVAAKVRLFANASYTGNSIDVTTVGWALNVTNKKYFPMSERTETWMEGGGTTNAGDGSPRNTYESPFDIWEFGSYRKDPNYEGQKTSMTDISTTPYTDNYTYYTHSNVPTWSAVTAGPSTNPNASKIPALYCLENTQEEADNYQAYSTHVLLKATVVPTGLKLPGGATYNGPANSDTDVNDSGNVISGKDWIKVGKGYYSYKLVIKYIEAELTSKYEDKDPDNFPTSFTTTFNTYISYLAGKSGSGVTAVTLPTKDEFDAFPGANDAERVTSIANKFYQQKVIDNGADIYGSISYYKGGDSYYTIMIKHDNDTNDTNNKLGEFGVVRNSVYDITIKSIMNPGYPIIQEPDPGKKDEEEEFYMSIEIGINPWTWYEQGVDL